MENADCLKRAQTATDCQMQKSWSILMPPLFHIFMMLQKASFYTQADRFHAHFE